MPSIAQSCFSRCQQQSDKSIVDKSIPKSKRSLSPPDAVCQQHFRHYMRFADQCLSSCKLKGGKQPPCHQLFQAACRKAQASCPVEQTSIWLFPRSKEQLLGKKSTQDHPRWGCLARQELGTAGCHKGNLQTNCSGEVRSSAFWCPQFFQLSGSPQHSQIQISWMQTFSVLSKSTHAFRVFYSI